MSATAEHVHVTTIEPVEGWANLGLRELWEYRELVYFFTWRDIKVRYKQTILGGAWAILQPFLTMVVFTVFFGRLAKVPSNGIPYPIFSYAALVPWTFFQNGLTNSSTSTVSASNMISKVYFPRMTSPLSSVLSGLVDFVLAFVVLLGMMAYYDMWPNLRVLWLPLFVLLAFVAAVGGGLWLSAMNVKYRDVKYIVPFLAQFWMFATPIVYPSSLVPHKYRVLMGLNPISGVVEGFRWALLRNQPSPGAIVFASALVTIVLTLGGAMYFRRTERTFADVI